MTTYDPGPRRPPPPCGLLLAVLPEPGHQLWLDTSANVVVERWDVDGQTHEVTHQLPWDWTTDPPRSTSGPASEWTCPACDTVTVAATSDQLASFIVGHPCRGPQITASRPLRAVPSPRSA